MISGTGKSISLFNRITVKILVTQTRTDKILLHSHPSLRSKEELGVNICEQQGLSLVSLGLILMGGAYQNKIPHRFTARDFSL
jgi:hypothetical protein